MAGDDAAAGRPARQWKWDVALSFAGAQRDYVEQVAAALKAQGVRCFYDADEQIALWGQDLAKVLPAIFGEQAAAVVVFVSAECAARYWTQVERRAALDRAVRERREYVLPARFDDTDIPELAGKITINLRGLSPQKFADMVATKLVELGVVSPFADAEVADAIPGGRGTGTELTPSEPVSGVMPSASSLIGSTSPSPTRPAEKGLFSPDGDGTAHVPRWGGSDWHTAWGEDAYLARVAEVTRLLHPDAAVKVGGTDDDGPPHLQVTVERPGRPADQWLVGVCEHGVDAVAVEMFATWVRSRDAAGEPRLASELVYGGLRADHGLVAAALLRGVRLVRFLDYQEELVDLRGYLTRQSGLLAANPEYPPGLYVPQRMSRLDQPDVPPVDDAIDEVARWLAADGPLFALLLADFGHGKTFLLRELARRLPDRLPHLIPVLVELRTLEKAHSSVDELLALHFIAAGEDGYDRKKFGYLLRAGRVVLLFDGFDELALRVTYDRAADHLKTLLDAIDGDAKIVMTSRRQHFISDDQVRTALASGWRWCRRAGWPGWRTSPTTRSKSSWKNFSATSSASPPTTRAGTGRPPTASL
jgi:hypothetical protein